MGEKLASDLETLLEVSMAQEWIYETDRWILGCCWLPLAVGTLMLAYFGCGELLANIFPHLLLFYFSSLWLALVYAMMILNLNMHTTVTLGGGGRDIM